MKVFALAPRLGLAFGMTRILLPIPLLLTLALLIAGASGCVAHAEPVNGEYDTDGDGLIDVKFLEQLDAIRYDLDGNGKADDDSGIEAYAAAYPVSGEEMVCDDNCKGYELTRALDFNDPDSYASRAVNVEWTTGDGWAPIPAAEDMALAEEVISFHATFDGNGYTISNLYINRVDEHQVGLFGLVGDSIIREIGLVDADVSGLAIVGGLTGFTAGTIEDSYVTGRVLGAVYVGGLAGFTDYSSEISGCRFSGTVTARESDGEAVGGLVGYQDGVIRDSSAAGSVSGDKYVGGLAGENRGNIVASYSSAHVVGNAGVGGLAGVNRVLISGSYATGKVTGGSGVGGLAGYNGAKIIASYSTSAVTGDEGVGGLTGRNTGDITVSYAAGQVSGDENVGGLAGRNTDEAGITASYATGRVSGGDNLGGVIGFNDANVAGAVWDTETSGIGNGVGTGDATGTTGQTTAKLQGAAGYAGVYRDWEIYFEEGKYRDIAETPGPYDFWDFGTSAQYPALRAYLGFGGFTEWWESGKQSIAPRPPASTPVPASVVSPSLVRYDSDMDGLIEVSNLEQLDAIRHDLDGDGIPENAAKDEYAAAYPVSDEEKVCGNACQGYELARPLDFNDADSYASGAINAEWTADEGWRPIGSEDGYGGRFNAIFDGNGHLIVNLYVDRTTPSEEPPAVGLFGYTGHSAVIHNTGIINASVAGLEKVGALVGRNMGEISDSYATGNVSGHDYRAGGLVGENEGVISSSRAAVDMSCGEHGDSFGGLAGWNYGAISNSHATGRVSCGEHNDFLGGLTGANWGTISNSYATGDITGDGHVGGLTGSVGLDSVIIASYATGDVMGGRGVGGLAGGSSGVISGSYATGGVTGDSNVGGLAGANGGRIIASYATGEVTGVGFKSGYSGRVSGGGEVGGLVGSNSYGRIIASYATGAVSGESNVGGLAGESHSSRVVASYATGSVSGDVETGGLVGAESATIGESVSFWDTQTTGRETSAAGKGKTTAELQSPTDYRGIFEGWDADLDDADGDNDPATGVDDFWDFGTSSEYPALKFDFDGDGTETWQEFGHQVRSAPTVEPAPHTTPTVEDSCLERVAADGVVSGTWNSACVSFNRPGSYARFYVFTLDADAELFITLESGDTNTYLYMQKGVGRTSRSFRSQGSADRYSRIEHGFAAGTYTIEAATYEAGQSGSFTLTISGPEGTTPAPVPATVSPALTVRYDSDEDGLIEVSNLEQLDAIRYDLDGDGKADDASGIEVYAAAFPGAVCNNCNGYELGRPLDFNDADSYASGAVNVEWAAGEGWHPIGGSRHPFAATFNGNGHAVSNLYITPTTQADSSPVDGLGLFGSVGASGVIRETGLLNANVTGGDFVGTLVGANKGTVSHSYAAGSVSGYGCIGGLVGSNDFGVIKSSYAAGSVSGGKYIGGLAGCNNDGAIRSSYATGSVSGDTIKVGGLAGYQVGGLAGNNGGSVAASYATGSVRGQKYVGGLVGKNDDGSISASYSASEVTGGQYIGGLVGGNEGMVGYGYAVGKVSSDGAIDAPQRYIGGLAGYNPGIIHYGLWDTESSGHQVGIGIEIGDGQSSDIFGKTTAELQSPAGYTGPYQGWDVSLSIGDKGNTPDYSLSDFLDFGTSGQYPALKVDFDGDGTATWREFGNQRRDAPGPAPAPVVENCVEIMTTAVASGAWSSDCASVRQPGSYARFYTFTLADPSEVIIDLESGETDTYLYLLQGAGSTGEILEVYGSGSRSSKIAHTLSAGTYTVEAATYAAAQTGSFTLTVNGLATPPPPPLHTPALIPTVTLPPIPTPTLTPTPTPTFVPASTSAPVEPTNAPEPTAIAAQEPAPAADSGGGSCNAPSQDTPTGAGAVSLFLLAAPLAMIGGLKFRRQRKRGSN